MLSQTSCVLGEMKTLYFSQPTHVEKITEHRIRRADVGSRGFDLNIQRKQTLSAAEIKLFIYPKITSHTFTVMKSNNSKVSYLGIFGLSARKTIDG